MDRRKWNCQGRGYVTQVTSFVTASRRTIICVGMRVETCYIGSLDLCIYISCLVCLVLHKFVAMMYTVVRRHFQYIGL